MPRATTKQVSIGPEPAGAAHCWLGAVSCGSAPAKLQPWSCPQCVLRPQLLCGPGGASAASLGPPTFQHLQSRTSQGSDFLKPSVVLGDAESASVVL